MKARTPIMANKTLLDGQLHSSGPKMSHFTKLDEVTFKQHLMLVNMVNMVNTLLSLHSLDL